MAQTVNVKNFGSLNKLAQTVLSQDIAAAVTILPVTNSNDFTAGPVLIGAAGSSNPEMVTATAPSTGTQIPVGATTLQHNNNDPVFLLFGDKINVYSAPDLYGTGVQPPDNTFTPVTGSPFKIDANKVETAINDPNGIVGTWYKFTYINSLSMAETAIANSTAAQAGQTHYVSIDQVRRAAGFANSPNVTDDIIAEFRDAAEREINGALLPVYAFPLPVPTNPLVVQIAKDIAAGELKHEQYQIVAPTLAAYGQTTADKARNGGGEHTSLADLVTRTVVLEDANFAELTIEEGHGFGGWPDASTQNTPSWQGGDHGHQFKIDEEY